MKRQVDEFIDYLLLEDQLFTKHRWNIVTNTWSDPIIRKVPYAALGNTQGTKVLGLPEEMFQETWDEPHEQIEVV